MHEPLLLVLLCLLYECYGVVRHLPPGEPTENVNQTLVKLRMPGISPSKVTFPPDIFVIFLVVQCLTLSYLFKNDDYLCTGFSLEGESNLYITQFKIEGSAERAHHMLLYGCGDIPSRDGYWFVNTIL